MKNVWIPVLIVWTVVIVLQQVAIFTFREHITEQKDLLMTYQISLCECLSATENCVEIVTRKKELFINRDSYMKGGDAGG